MGAYFPQNRVINLILLFEGLKCCLRFKNPTHISFSKIKYKKEFNKL